MMVDEKSPNLHKRLGLHTNQRRNALTTFPRRILRQIALAGLLALPTFNSSSHSTLSATVTFTIEDTSLRYAESELQLRGSFRIIPPTAGFTKFPFHGANGATPELELKRT